MREKDVPFALEDLRASAMRAAGMPEARTIPYDLIEKDIDGFQALLECIRKNGTPLRLGRAHNGLALFMPASAGTFSASYSALLDKVRNWGKEEGRRCDAFLEQRSRKFRAYGV